MTIEVPHDRGLEHIDHPARVQREIGNVHPGVLAGELDEHPRGKGAVIEGHVARLDVAEGFQGLQECPLALPPTTGSYRIAAVVWDVPGAVVKAVPSSLVPAGVTNVSVNVPLSAFNAMPWTCVAFWDQPRDANRARHPLPGDLLRCRWHQLSYGTMNTSDIGDRADLRPDRSTTRKYARYLHPLRIGPGHSAIVASSSSIRSLGSG